jgi:hypothetical protein
MLFQAFGTLTAIWLLMSPLLELETGFRSGLAVSVGLAALLLAPLGFWHRWANGLLAGLGAVLMFANFIQAPPIPSMANFAVCAVALVAAGMAPMPRVEAARLTAGNARPPSDAVPATAHSFERDTERLAA